MEERKQNADRPLASRSGVSLIETLIVVVAIGILAAMLAPLANPSLATQVADAGYVVAADLQYARQLAVANSSKYKLTFTAGSSSYSLTHSGTDASLNALPSPAFRSDNDTSTSKVTNFSEIPSLEDTKVHAIYCLQNNSRTAITQIEFDSLGGTTSTQISEVWLSSGSGSERRYVCVTVNAITGLADVGSVVGTAP